jgi:hypothetical protein
MATKTPRPNRTYRASRRNDWRSLDGVTWQEHNAPAGGRDPWHIGTGKARRAISHVARSKYMPHIGAKQLGKAAARIGG